MFNWLPLILFLNIKYKTLNILIIILGFFRHFFFHGSSFVFLISLSDMLVVLVVNQKHCHTFKQNLYIHTRTDIINNIIHWQIKKINLQYYLCSYVFVFEFVTKFSRNRTNAINDGISFGSFAGYSRWYVINSPVRIQQINVIWK